MRARTFSGTTPSDVHTPSMSVPALAVTEYADKTRPEEGWTFRVIWLDEEGGFAWKALAVTRNRRTKALEFVERQARD